ncbi:MAG TPA: HAMP domain-containing sensor histidine kinase [Gemmatimonadales bacterium]|nr:HAMP domain-containing sensor histidine kinase [Gemmatimonadales bacterium]
MTSLDRLRLKLTLWYAGVFTLILLVLGLGLFRAIRRQISRQLDQSLVAAAHALEQAARVREVERAQARGPVADAVEELHIPDRALFLLDSAGGPVIPASVPEPVLAAARDAARTGTVDRTLHGPHDHDSRLHAERFAGGSGTPYIALVTADRIELEDQYASLIETLAAGALAALVLVAAGGWFLVRQSTAPIEQSMERMRRFMADAAHELRTPVTILRTRADLALGQPRDSARDTAVLESVAREAGRIGAIVGDLLTLARADAGERPIAEERVFLDDLAADTVNDLRPLAERRGVAVAVGAFEECAVRGDPVLLRRLLRILLDNAIKFTPAGGRVRIDVGTEGGGPAIRVVDTGIGIPPDQLPHVFERFYRGDAGRQEGEGAGLGLAIARWIADAHHATIDITSSPSGTDVRVRFVSLP